MNLTAFGIIEFTVSDTFISIITQRIQFVTTRSCGLVININQAIRPLTGLIWPVSMRSSPLNLVVISPEIKFSVSSISRLMSGLSLVDREDMDVTAESITAMQQAAIGEKIAIAVMHQQIVTQKQIGEGLVQLIEAAGSVGGGRVSVYA